MFNPLLQPKALFRISKYYNQEQNCIKILNATVTDVYSSFLCIHFLNIY